jgi:hypothetical protein
MTNGVFSDFEVEKLGVKFKDATETKSMNCVGSIEEDMAAKVITKKCRGVTIKSITKGTGEGTLNISVHMPYDIYKESMGMELDTLKEGVVAYGSNSVHKEFCLTAFVKDEDGAEKYKAYPRCVFAKKPTVTIENGAEEVAHLEGEITLSPDENGNGMYEALAEGLDTTIATAWIDNFTPELVKVTSA